MRSILLFFLCFLTFGITLAQQEELSKQEKERREKNIQAGNPFAEFGYKAKVATLSKGKYLEVHDLDSIVKIGSSLWHVRKRKIVGNVEQDTTDIYRQPLFETAGRWLSPDPLAEEAPDWTPYRFAFNNPLSFVDPDGLYEWRVNSETGEYERFGDKGGNEEQYIFFNDDKEATNVMKGETIYVGAAALNRYKDGEVSYAVSTKDLWSDLPDEYQGAYTTGDLIERYQAQQKGNDKYNMIINQEAQGLARRNQIWNNQDLRNHLIEVYGSDSGLALAAATGMLQTIVDFSTSAGPSPKANRKGNKDFSPVFKSNSTKLSNNSWIRFLQTNKGKYKGLGKKWIHQASKDYQALKAAGEL